MPLLTRTEEDFSSLSAEQMTQELYLLQKEYAPPKSYFDMPEDKLSRLISLTRELRLRQQNSKSKGAGKKKVDLIRTEELFD